METKIIANVEKDLWARFSATFTHAVLPQPEQETKKTAAIPKAMAKARSLICIPDRWMQCSKKHQYEAGLAAVTKAVLEMEHKATTATAVPDVDCPAEFLPALLKAAEGLKTSIADDAHLKALMHALVRKGFHEGETFDVKKYTHNGSQYDQLFNALFTLPRRKKEVLALGLYVMYSLCSKDEVGSTMTRIGDHMTVCQPGQQQGADYLFVVAGMKLDAGAQASEAEEDDDGDILEMGFYNFCHEKLLGRVAEGVIPTHVVEVHGPTQADLEQKFEGYFQEYLDDHKERALFSGVFEPAKYVLTAAGNSGQADNFDVHGQNWYLVAMIEALGEAAFPILPVEDDFSQQSTIHPYGNLNSKAERSFQDPANFGKGFGAIKPIREKAGYKKKNKVTHKSGGDHRFGSYSKPVDIRAVFDAERKHAEDEKADQYRDVPADIKHWAVMAEHLAFFFCQDFFIPKCFETLNGETKPEYVGFRQCCVDLFQFYKKAPEFVKPQRPAADQDQDEEPEELDQDGEFYAHCYEDEYYTKLDLDAVTHFFQWLGVVKPQRTFDPRPEAKNETFEDFEEDVLEGEDLIREQEAAGRRGMEQQEVALKRQALEEEKKRLKREVRAQRHAAQKARAGARHSTRGVATFEDEVEEAEELAALFAVPPPVAGGGDAEVDHEEVKLFEREPSVDMVLSPAGAVGWDRVNTFEGEFDTAPVVVRIVS